jgi:hypothetical protein
LPSSARSFSNVALSAYSPATYRSRASSRPSTASSTFSTDFCTLSFARAWNSSRVHCERATPITGRSRCPRRSIEYSAGKIFL